MNLDAKAVGTEGCSERGLGVKAIWVELVAGRVSYRLVTGEASNHPHANGATAGANETGVVSEDWIRQRMLRIPWQRNQAFVCPSRVKSRRMRIATLDGYYVFIAVKTSENRCGANHQGPSDCVEVVNLDPVKEVYLRVIPVGR